MSRRDVLALGLAAAATAVIPRSALAATVASADDATRFAHMADRFAEEILRLTPVAATELGLDGGPRSALKSALNDDSPAGDARWRQQADSMLKRLAQLDRSRLPADEQIRFDKLLHTASTAAAASEFALGRAAQGFFGSVEPYPVTQQGGAVTAIPEFLDSKHRITSATDAEAYLARVEAMAVLLDQESARVVAQAGTGVTPPDFILRTALGQLQRYRAQPAGAQKLVSSLAERTRAKGLAGDWQGRAVALVEQRVYPAIDRQIAALNQAASMATEVPGVHRFADGAAYYQWALKLGTTTNATAEEVHAIGLEQTAEIAARMDAILKGQGMTQGSVGQRMQALTRDPARYFADDNAGRAALIGFCNERVSAIRQLMPQLSHLDLKAPLVIKRVPTDIEAGAALGYMSAAALDGSRPATYYINLKSTRNWARHELSTLTAHEGIPGHTWQFAYLAERSGRKPVIDSLLYFNAFIEGWALYAEQLCDEAGLYAADPMSRLGYLSLQQFRAARLVVDTGLHAKRWTRQQAVGFLVEHTGRDVVAMTSEIDRYTVSPGQACGYKMGHNEILRLRSSAQATLGPKFDGAAFNDALVQSTGVPLTVLSSVVDRYIAVARHG
jgi:uncharacterized protein (DUF885 family)